MKNRDLDRYAGRFVWLELDFDKSANQSFIVRHAVTYTPTLFVFDPTTEEATATQLGGLTLPEIAQFLERGEAGLSARTKSPAGIALARGDEMLGRGRRAEAVVFYRDALVVAPAAWTDRDRAVQSLTWALSSERQWQDCAEVAAKEAPSMARGESFSRVVLSGLMCASSDSAAWTRPAHEVLEPLALEATRLPATLRDHRFQLYQQLMRAADIRGDKNEVARFGNSWLDEIDGTTPKNDDERSALDIARVDAASDLEDPSRVLSALQASEKAMPQNYNASLRLAQMQFQAKRYDDAVSSCDRGLKHVTGPVGRVWLLEVKAQAQAEAGRTVDARRTLGYALHVAHSIAMQESRERNVRKINDMLGELTKQAH